MAAEEGNKYAEKYTRDVVMSTLNACIKTMNTPPYYKCLEYSLKVNEINRHKLHYFSEKFKDDVEVLNTIKDLRSEAESNNSIGVSEGEIPVAWGAFNAKVNFGWVEKGVELEINAQKQLIQVHSVSPSGKKKPVNG